MTAAIDIRPCSDSEMAFVRDSWARSYEDDARPRWCRKRVWYSGHRDVTTKCLRDATVSVAVPSNVPGEVLGWVAYDVGRGLLHYAYVKDWARRKRIATQLVAHAMRDMEQWAMVVATHMTKRGRPFLDDKKLAFDPFAWVEVIRA